MRNIIIIRYDKGATNIIPLSEQVYPMYHYGINFGNDHIHNCIMTEQGMNNLIAIFNESYDVRIINNWEIMPEM